MTSRERMLAALANRRPDRMACQVHGWMDYISLPHVHVRGWQGGYLCV